MNVPPEVLEVLQNWVRKAENDLEAARHAFAVAEKVRAEIRALLPTASLE